VGKALRSRSAFPLESEALMFSLRRLTREDGQDLLEYAMLASLIALCALGAVTLLGNHINTVFWQTIGPSIPT